MTDRLTPTDAKHQAERELAKTGPMLVEKMAQAHYEAAPDSWKWPDQAYKWEELQPWVRDGKIAAMSAALALQAAESGEGEEDLANLAGIKAAAPDKLVDYARAHAEVLRSVEGNSASAEYIERLCDALPSQPFEELGERDRYKAALRRAEWHIAARIHELQDRHAPNKEVGEAASALNDVRLALQERG